MSLEKLKIPESPAAFASFAAKHNNLTDLLAALKGIRGVKVTVSEKNIVIEADPSTTPENLLSEIHLTFSTPTYGNDLVIDLDENGFYLRWNSTAGGVRIDTNGLILYADGGANTVSMNWGDISQNVSFREIDVCDAGVAKKMLVLGSAAYVP